MNRGLLQRIEKTQEEYQSYFKQKADILSLKQKPKTKVKWPMKVYGLDGTKKVNERNVYTKTEEKSIAKVNVTKYHHFKRTAWDPQLNTKGNFRETKWNREKSLMDDTTENDLIGFVKTSKSPLDSSSVESAVMDDQDTDLIKDLSLQLLDQVINNITNPLVTDPSQPKKDLDWEFMLANALQTELPPVVIDRVKRHMALITGKNTPAITALNVTPCQLSDLTMSDTEMEMMATIQELYAQTENESFEPLPPGDLHQDIKWLMDLSRKDKQDQLSEIDKINSEYSNRALNLKSAFF